MTLNLKQKLFILDIAFVLSFIIAQFLVLREFLKAYFTIPAPKIIISAMLLIIWLVIYNSLSTYILTSSLKKIPLYLKKIGEGKKVDKLKITKDEIGVIYKSIKDLSYNLDKNFRNIKEARDFDRQKTEFLLLSSHQLRTPLTSAKWGLSELKKHAQKLPEDSQLSLSAIEEGIARSIEIVNELLKTAEFSFEKENRSWQAIDLKIIINKITKRFRISARNKQLKFNIEIDPKLSPLYLNPHKLQSALQCLIENAVDYADTNSKITIKANIEKDALNFAISNRGFGISKKDSYRIFKKFFRSKGSLKKKTEGYGLCLFLTKNIIESLGGKIWFKSQPKKTTTFYFSLPLDPNAKIDKFLKSF